MLQQILKDMYVDPDVLDGLNDDQKKTLFMKMREEQVRRWNEREEKLEREGGDPGSKRAKPRKANSKSVSWLLGRDGDVAVIVIGEVDELTSKFICPGLEERKPPSLQSYNCHQNVLKSKITTQDVRSVPSKTQPEASSNLKGTSEEESPLLPLAVSAAENAPSAEATTLEPKEKPAPQASICSRPPARAVPVGVRPASANPTPGSISTRPGHANPKPVTTASSSSSSGATVKSDSGLAPPGEGDLGSKEPQKPQEAQGGKGALGASQRPGSGEAGAAPTCAGRGRVAQLKKTFSVDPSTQTPARGIKPALPTKPSHLRLTTR